MNTTTDHPETEQDFQDSPGRSARRRLRRPVSDRMIAGVAAGIADYLDVDPTIVRIVLAALTLAGGAGIAVYIAGWLLIPEAGSEQSIADEFIGGRAR
jgi:phage shock protein PspC (stress-responsive transcriptional regulator)